MKYILILAVTLLLGCEQEYYSGYVTNKEYGRCRGEITVIDNTPYCNGNPLRCDVTVGDWVNGEFIQHVNSYDSGICTMIQYNDYIP
jgi:hypothetical protein